MAERTQKANSYGLAKTGIVTGKQGIYETSTTRKHTVGERFCFGDGRVFYYALNSGTATTQSGVFFVADCDISEDDSTVSEAVGEKEIEFTTAGAVGDSAFAGGFLVANAGTDVGEGQIFKIQDNWQSTTSGNSVLHLHDELPIALVAAGCCAHENFFYKVQTGNDEQNLTLGVALVAVPASSYFWLQTWGPAPVIIADGGVGAARDEQVVFSATGGSRGITTALGPKGKQILGNVVYSAGDTVQFEVHPVNLKIMP